MFKQGFQNQSARPTEETDSFDVEELETAIDLLHELAEA